ncbi:hypothetical protein ACHAXT_008921 [Thalassiosira profunda]
MAANEFIENGGLAQAGISMLSDDCLALILSYVVISKEDIAAVCAALPFFEAASKTNIVWKQLLNMGTILAKVDAQYERKAAFPAFLQESPASRLIRFLGNIGTHGVQGAMEEADSIFDSLNEASREAQLAMFGGPTAGFHFEGELGIDCINTSTDLVVYTTSDPSCVGNHVHTKEMGETLSWSTRKSATMVFVWDALIDGQMEWRQQPMAEVITEILGEDGHLWLLDLTMRDGAMGSCAHYTAIEIPVVDAIASACAAPDGRLFQAYQMYCSGPAEKKKKASKRAPKGK